jgi:hypothetical protein
MKLTGKSADVDVVLNNYCTSQSAIQKVLQLVQTEGTQDEVP